MAPDLTMRGATKYGVVWCNKVLYGVVHQSMIDLSEIECRMYQNVSEWSRAESSATVAPDFTMSVVQQSVVK